MHSKRLQDKAGHFVSTVHPNPPTTSQAVETTIRTANIGDLTCLVLHRRAMFEEMGYRDALVLNEVEKSSRDYFSDALCLGTYKAWLAEDGNGRIAGGGGIVIAAWPGYPGETHAKRAWILNMYTEPAARHRGVAKQLLQVMLEWCRNNGFRTVSLHASYAGRPLYESVGFQATNEMRLALWEP